MTDKLTLPLVEQFGPTIQGEGPSTGRAAAFVRFGQCNLSCGWCDTPYSWDDARYDLETEITDWPIAGILDRVADTGAGLVVLTGGEPMMQHRKPAFHQLLAGLTALAVDVEVETNGTIPPTGPVVDLARFNVSPKLANAGMDTAKTLRPRALTAYAELAKTGRAVFKFVAAEPEDLAEVEALARDYEIPARAVWIMPEGTQPGPLLDAARALVDHVTGRGWNLTPRVHALLWPNERER